MVKRKICIITGTRAEYGLLKPLMDRIINDSDFILQVIVTGAHLSSEFGHTISHIENDGIPVAEKVEMLLGSDTPVGIAKSMGLGLIGLAEAYTRLKPDIIVLLGDRYEILCAAAAALIQKIPIAHIHGGEITEGAFDESIRHAVTKLSHYHFTAAEQYRKRVIQLGEDPNKVFNVGAIGLDAIKSFQLFTRAQLESDLKIRFRKQNFLVTFHPATLELQTAQEQFTELLNALSHFKGTFKIFTKANADTGGRLINKMLAEFVEDHSNHAVLFDSLGQLRYISIMKLCDAVIGNSSSGIIEAPFLKIPTVNIGDRQKGRIKADSIIDCIPEQNVIEKSVRAALESSFRLRLENLKTHYGNGTASDNIVSILKHCSLDVRKPFHDIEVHS